MLELEGRDSEGQIVGMRMILNDYVTSFAGEAIAWLQGVQMGLDLGFQRVILEGFNIVRRNANEAAHQLAKEGLIKGEISYLMERIPETVRKAVEDDNRWAEIGHLHHSGSLGGSYFLD
ncbi:hypothetical protein J1N35_041765 [Gossypium stocksii]|uniref:RNase H type-1 domain-containing protein n=1 Tax=Gossypium stocksii TaxID=47602 RepID=A0A9D3UG34_9ROSI|nr:hypothetical protein J1N35_041765 [Gossypium stocksii]